MIEFTANVVRYDGNNSTTSFDYTFLIFSDTDLQVYVDGVLQTLSSDYTVTGVNLAEGGTVEFAVPPPSGTNNVLIERFVPYTQTISIPEGSKFPARLVETGMDRIVVMLHQLFDKSFRGISLAVTAATGSEDLDISQNSTQRADRVIAFTDTGNAVTVGPTVAELESLLEATSTLEIPANNLRGRGSAGGTGPVQNITLGTGLALNGTVLEASAAGQPSTDVHSRFEGFTVGLNLDAGPTVDTSNPDQARLTDCRYLVTDKGTIVTPRLGLLADFATVGAGGRDRADDGTSGHRWWDIYYIYKSTEADPGSPAEDSLLFSPSQCRTQVAGFSTTLDTAHLIRFNSATQQAAQGFTPTVALSELHDVVLSINKNGSPTGNVWAEIHADSGGVPSGVPLATSQSKNVSRFLGSYAWTSFQFKNTQRISLNASTLYWIVVRGDFAIDGTNFLSWGRVTAGGYSGGTVAHYNGTSWSAGTADARFMVHGVPVDTTVTMPSGYDEKCLLGFVQTTANGAEFIACSGTDREYIDRSAVSGTVGTPRFMSNPVSITSEWYSSSFGASTQGFPVIPYRPSMRQEYRSYGIAAALTFGVGGPDSVDMPAAIPVTYASDSMYYTTTATSAPTSLISINVGMEGGATIVVSAGSGSVLSRTGFKW